MLPEETGSTTLLLLLTAPGGGFSEEVLSVSEPIGLHQMDMSLSEEVWFGEVTDNSYEFCASSFSDELSFLSFVLEEPDFCPKCAFFLLFTERLFDLCPCKMREKRVKETLSAKENAKYLSYM